MSFTPEQKKALEAPLLATHVKDRSQGGRKVSYVEGWHAIAEANRIFGADNWDRETISMRQVDVRERAIGAAGKPGWEVSYVAKVKVTVRADAHVVVKEGYGFGQGIDANVGMAIESAVKEAETDAMKRALMMFGNPFGLALYDKDKTNVSNVDINRIDEFREALEVVEDGTSLEALIREYSGDIIDLKVSQQDEWKKLNDMVIAKRGQFKQARLAEAKEEVQ